MKNKLLLIVAIGISLFIISVLIINKHGITPPETAYVINLESRKNLFDNLSKQLSKNNIKYQRFVAIDGYDITIENLSTNLHFTGKMLKKNPELINKHDQYQVSCSDNLQFQSSLYNNWNDKKITAGELGCTCSHLSLWKKIANDSAENALIFEDDIKLRPNFNQHLTHLLTAAPRKFDIIYLSLWIPASKTGVVTYQNPEVAKITEPIFTSGSTAYIISKDGARKLLSLTQEINDPIDMTLASLVKKLDIYVDTNQQIENDRSSRSAIAEMGRDH